jgi:hypothetical protein
VKLSLTESIDSVLEQTALAFMIHPSHGCKPPLAMISCVTRTTKNISRVVLVHSAFLGGYQVPYVSPPAVGGKDIDGDDVDKKKDEGSEAEDEINGVGKAQALGTEPEGHEILDFNFMDLSNWGEMSEDSSEIERSKEILV